MLLGFNKSYMTYIWYTIGSQKNSYFLFFQHHSSSQSVGVIDLMLTECHTKIHVKALTSVQ